MAEFTEVIRQKYRMCKSYKECDSCPLYTFDCNVIPSTPSEVEKYENIVMEWAKENPEITNADKLYQIIKDAFGEEMTNRLRNLYTVDTTNKCDHIECCDECDCQKCKNNGFWNKPYVEPNEGE